MWLNPEQILSMDIASSSPAEGNSEGAAGSGIGLRYEGVLTNGTVDFSPLPAPSTSTLPPSGHANPQWVIGPPKKGFTPGSNPDGVTKGLHVGLSNSYYCRIVRLF